MFADLSPQEQQRAARAYMQQNGSQASPANMSSIMNQLMSNPDLATAAMNALNGGDVTNTNSGGNSAGSRINDIMSALMAQDGTAETPMPPSRPANVAVAPSSNQTPPSRPASMSGDDRVAKAGGPGGRVNGTANASAPASSVAEAASDPSMSSIIMSVLAGAGGAGAYGLGNMLGSRGAKQMPPEVAEEIVTAGAPKQLPPAAGGPATSAIEQRMNALLSGGDIEDADFTEVTEQKKLPAPNSEDDSDKRPKAKSDEPIEAKDETKKTKATTAKEKLKPKVRVK